MHTDEAMVSASSAPGSQAGKNEKPMSTARKTKPAADIAAEYDFCLGVRGKCARRCTERTNLVLLEPDAADVFRSPAEGQRRAAQSGPPCPAPDRINSKINSRLRHPNRHEQAQVLNVIATDSLRG